MIFLNKNARFLAAYYWIFRKFIKNITIKKSLFNKDRRYWIFLRLNTPITKKTKNSRMGKGKGFIYNWLIRLPKGYKLIEFKNVNFSRIYFLAKKWSRRINLPLCARSKLNE